MNGSNSTDGTGILISCVDVFIAKDMLRCYYFIQLHFPYVC